MTTRCSHCGGELRALRYLESMCMSCGQHFFGFTQGMEWHPNANRFARWGMDTPMRWALTDYPSLAPEEPKEFVTTEFERKFAVAEADLIIANHQKEDRA